MIGYCQDFAVKRNFYSKECLCFQSTFHMRWFAFEIWEAFHIKTGFIYEFIETLDSMKFDKLENVTAFIKCQHPALKQSEAFQVNIKQENC